ncbi:MAG: TldD/PmbA family protein [Parasphingopyxis sp.]|uniref:TldD/PmbA family protein n=1 Tax=Parasphingopyxis sp. TaxID=1920299 RepID=UPI003FA07145
MLTVTEAQARVSDLVASAKRAGADAADVLYSGGMSTEVQVRLGELEDVQRSEGEEIGLRFFVGQRSASVSSSDLSDAALATLVERAAAMAREAPADAYAGLAPEDRLFTGELPDLDIDDGQDVAPETLRRHALEAEDAARAVDGVTNSEGGGASAGRSIMALATSHGFCGGYQASSYGCSASVIAGEGGGMQRDYAYRTARHFADLDSPASIGRRAGERTVARLDPAKLASGAMPVVFDPRVSGGLLGHLIGAITGSAITRGTSFLRDSLEKQVFSRGVTVRDDPLRRRGLRSRPFDGEGLPVADRAIIDDGVLTGWLLDSASARQLGLEPTGHAKRGIGGPPGAGATNLHLEAGTATRDQLIADIEQGVLVTELIGMGVNPVTGDYSRGASGFLIEKGAIGAPVAEITIAGNLKDMYRELTPADDLEFIRGVNAPSVRIEGMTVAGA